jgi:hypothetical protein
MFLVMWGEVEICFSMCMRKRTQQRVTAQPSDGSRGPWAAASAGPGAGAGLGRLEVRDQIRRCRHTCRPAALAQSGHGGGGARGLRGLQARDGVGPSDGRGGVGGHGAVDDRVEEAQLVLDLGRRRDDSDRAKRPRLSPTENTNWLSRLKHS